MTLYLLLLFVFWTFKAAWPWYAAGAVAFTIEVFTPFIRGAVNGWFAGRHGLYVADDGTLKPIPKLDPDEDDQHNNN